MISKEDIEQIRNKELSDVLQNFGAVKDPSDKNNWKTENGGRITVNGLKWYDHNYSVGGGGAIDLVMHLADCNFKKAVETLIDMPSQMSIMEKNIFAPMPKQVAPTEKNISVIPLADPTKWQQVKNYLVEKRGLDEKLIDLLHDQGLVFADTHANCCFLSHSKKGCELRGTGESDFHGYRGEKSAFYVVGGKEKKVAFVESAMDAISLQQLGFNGIIGSFGGQAINHCIETAKKAQAKGYAIFAAFDNDEAGREMAKKIKEAIPSVEVLAPSAGKDWNDVVCFQKVEKDSFSIGRF